MKFSHLLPILAALFIFFTTGCVDPALVLRYDPEARRPVRIGVLLPLTGSKATFGKRMLQGVRFAASELNSRRGHFGRRVEILEFDTTGTGDGAARAFHSAVSAGAIGAIGGYSTEEAVAIAPLAKSLRVPTVLAMATVDDDLIGTNPFIYRTAFTNKQQAQMIAGYLYYYRKARRLLVTVSSDPGDIYSRNIARDVAESFRETGGEVSKVLEIDPDNPGKTFGEFVGYMPDALLLPFESRKAAKLFRLARDWGYNGLICGPDSWDDREFFKGITGMKKFGNCFYTAFFSNEGRHQEFISFRREFRKQRYYYPGSCEIQAYDAFKFLLTGFGNNATNLRRFDRNWRAIRRYYGAAALYTMLPNNQIDRTIYINSIGMTPGQKGVPRARTLTGIQYSRLELYKTTAEE